MTRGHFMKFKLRLVNGVPLEHGRVRLPAVSGCFCPLPRRSHALSRLTECGPGLPWKLGRGSSRRGGGARGEACSRHGSVPLPFLWRFLPREISVGTGRRVAQTEVFKVCCGPAWAFTATFDADAAGSVLRREADVLRRTETVFYW